MGWEEIVNLSLHLSLHSQYAEADLVDFRRHAGTDRPLGVASFLVQLEAQTDRLLQTQQRGPKGHKEGEM